MANTFMKYIKQFDSNYDYEGDIQDMVADRLIPVQDGEDLIFIVQSIREGNKELAINHLENVDTKLSNMFKNLIQTIGN